MYFATGLLAYLPTYLPAYPCACSFCCCCCFCRLLFHRVSVSQGTWTRSSASRNVWSRTRWRGGDDFFLELFFFVRNVSLTWAGGEECSVAEAVCCRSFETVLSAKCLRDVFCAATVRWIRKARFAL